MVASPLLRSLHRPREDIPGLRGRKQRLLLESIQLLELRAATHGYPRGEPGTWSRERTRAALGKEPDCSLEVEPSCGSCGRGLSGEIRAEEGPAGPHLLLLEKPGKN